jgi:uncharacterized protein
MHIPFLSHCILWFSIIACNVVADEPRLYTGEVLIPTMGPLEMTLGISDTDEGTFILLTVPTQGAKDIPLPATFKQDGSLFAELPQAALSFVVFENDDHTKLTGEMHQGLVFDIDFSRIEEHTELVRPQHPIGPFPYWEYEITAQHPEGHLLQGTLTIPEGRGPFSCAVLISGSGLQDRDESLMGHKPFLVIADFLTRNGIAVLRFDDRGVGGSVVEDRATLVNATTEDFATDVAVMVRAVRNHSEIDARRVGVIGHSEGGLIGPMVAVGDSKLAFVVMLAGPGVAGDELLPVQQARLLETSGADQDLIDALVHASMTLYEIMEMGSHEEMPRKEMEELVAIQFEAQGIDVSKELFEQAVDEGLEVMLSPWMQYFLFYDPAPTLAQVTCPVLALNGSKDVQVDARQNLTAIEQIKIESGNDITIIELDGLNHLFQPATTGAVSEYAQIETTFDPGALAIMTEWLLEVTDND